MPSSLRRLARAVLAPVFAVTALAACGSGISLDEPIEGPVWRLVQLGDQAIAPGGDPQRDAHLQFDGYSGRVSGSGGCNRFSGGFSRSHSQLRMSQLAATKMACTDPARGAMETEFFQALQATASYRLQGPGRLALLDAGGRTVAALQSGTGG